MRSPAFYRAQLKSVEAILADPSLTPSGRQSAEHVAAAYRAVIPGAEEAFARLTALPRREQTCALPDCEATFAPGHGRKTCSAAHRKALQRHRPKGTGRVRSQKGVRAVGERLEGVPLAELVALEGMCSDRTHFTPPRNDPEVAS
jgi:hypothetical protein